MNRSFYLNQWAKLGYGPERWDELPLVLDRMDQFGSGARVYEELGWKFGDAPSVVTC